jgi:hypothetical protein
MPDRRKSIPPPPVPPITHREEEVQSILRHMLHLVVLLQWFLEQAHLMLPDPPDAEAMGNGEIAETLAFSLRGSLECALHDHIEPLDDLLRKAVAETPENLVWALIQIRRNLDHEIETSSSIPRVARRVGGVCCWGSRPERRKPR